MKDFQEYVDEKILAGYRISDVDLFRIVYMFVEIVSELHQKPDVYQIVFEKDTSVDHCYFQIAFQFDDVTCTCEFDLSREKVLRSCLADCYNHEYGHGNPQADTESMSNLHLGMFTGLMQKLREIEDENS